MNTNQTKGISRRDFLRWSGATATMLVVAACAPSAPPPEAGAGAAEGGAAPAADKIVLRMQVDPEQEQPVVDMYKADQPERGF